MENKTVEFLKDFLKALGISGYKIGTSHDDMGFLIELDIPKENNEKIGILKGKKGQNLLTLKKALRIVGFAEGKNPYLIVKLTD